MTKMKARAATPEDVPGILRMIHELAEFEKLADQVVTTEKDLHSALFGDAPAAGALVADGPDGLQGYALYFTTFSSFLGKPGLWLEDIYVQSDLRGLGVGKALLETVVGIAREKGYGRCEWCVLDWNQRAIDFYQSMGGTILDEWRIVRMDREGMDSREGN